MDYSYSYEYNYDPSPAFGGAVFLLWLIGMAACVLIIASMWRLYKMAGHPGWSSIVPIYSNYVLCDIVFGNGLYFLAYFIPVAGQIFAIYTLFKFAKLYGKSDGFALGVVFLSGIFVPIMAFSRDTYYDGPSTALKGGYGSSMGGYNSYGSAGGYGNGYANQPNQTAGYDIYHSSQGVQNNGYQNNGYQNTGFQAQGGFQSQGNGFQTQGNDFQTQNGGSFDPHNANSYVNKEQFPNNNGGYNNF